MNKIVIITNGNYFAKVILKQLFEEYKNNIAGVVIINGDYYGRFGFKPIIQMFWLTEIHYFMYKIFQYLAFKVASYIYPKAKLEVKDLVKGTDIPIISSLTVNSEKVYSFIKSCQPDLIVSVSCPQRIDNNILELATLGGINIHSSLLPMYAGLAPYYWVLANGETVTGTTVHYMTEKFDEGRVLMQEKIIIAKGTSAFCLFLKLARMGGTILVEQIGAVFAGARGNEQVMSKGRSYYSHPTRESYINLKRHGFCLLRISELLNIIKGEIC